MARNKIGLEIDLEPIITKLEKIGVDAKKAVDDALTASKEYVNRGLVADSVKANYPAKGKYSTGDLAKSIDKGMTVTWSGMVGEIKIGYDMNKSGLTSIMILYGTPRMKKSTKLYNDIFGKGTREGLAEIQQEALNNLLEGR